MTASSTASALPCSRSATTIMCLANRFGTENVSGKRLEQEIPEVELRTDDDVVVVELPGDQASAIPPVQPTVTTPLGYTVEVSRPAG